MCLKISDLMRKEFISFQADDTVETITRVFAKEHITSAPVFDKTEYLGVVSELGIVSYFTPKKFLFLWQKNKPTPIETIKKVTAAMLAQKSHVSLNASQDVADCLKAIAARPYCLPVFEKGKVVGIIRDEDLVNFFLKEFAKGNVAEIRDSLGDSQPELGTEMDKILEIVKKEGSISCQKLSKQLNISVKTTEKLCERLQNHHLIRMDYSFLRGAIARRLEHERK